MLWEQWEGLFALSPIMHRKNLLLLVLFLQFTVSASVRKPFIPIAQAQGRNVTLDGWMKCQFVNLMYASISYGCTCRSVHWFEFVMCSLVRGRHHRFAP
jgi:hypothetical protein